MSAPPPTWTLARLIAELEERASPGALVWVRGVDGLRYPFCPHVGEEGEVVLEPVHWKEWKGVG